ncbi:hypothetical protein [Kineococcus aurantiacus]|uniref:Uncharacterized protein n=1 Tax=Kineococcus aurantiacus TaxID=37633 RepID=A0A7Y9DGN1_9ACTN|nr:hypothetical protein [Kineococcus aurantiacus]NYD20486.1 hypothetical protein [Kineococcus aurantiacus]
MKSLRCLLGRHRWVAERTDDHQPYRMCSRCRREDWPWSDDSPAKNVDEWTRMGSGLGPG